MITVVVRGIEHISALKMKMKSYSAIYQKKKYNLIL